jgi:hypothetical protein
MAERRVFFLRFDRVSCACQEEDREDNYVVANMTSNDEAKLLFMINLK